jgi:hypothetical protein
VEYMTERVTPGDAVLRFSGGESGIRNNSPNARCESWWWVSPLPPPGPVEFAIFLHGSPGPTGTARIDASQITSAAAKAEILWSEREPG